MSHRLRAVLVSISLATLAAGPADAQEILYQVRDQVQGELIGRAVTRLPDLTGDGIPEFAHGNWSLGRASLRSGADGSQLFLWTKSAQSKFGETLAQAGDVDNDGVADLLVGAPLRKEPGTQDRVGAAYVFSGATGAQLFRVLGDNDLDWLGQSLATMGDVNGDGHDDFAVGAPKLTSQYSGFGYVRVYSGRDASVLLQIDAPRDEEFFADAMTATDDLDGDGIRDLAVGAPFANSAGIFRGAVHVYSGASGAVLYSLRGEADSDFFGRCLASVKDRDRDGVGDLLVGAPQVPYGQGHVRVVSGRDGSSLGKVLAPLTTSLGQPFGYGHCSFGLVLASADDVNADGHEDYLTTGYMCRGCCANAGPYVEIISGATLRTLYRLNQPSLAGNAVGMGDVDGDGAGDLLTGSTDYQTGTPVGVVNLLRGHEIMLLAETPLVWQAPFSFLVREQHGGQPAMIAVQQGGGLIPVVFLNFDATGTATFAVNDIPPGLKGMQFTLQAFAVARSGRVLTSGPEPVSF